MMKKTIHFVLPGTSMRAFKRIDSFIRKGYDVKVFMIDRGVHFPIKSDVAPIIIGSLTNRQPYFKRIRILIKSIRKACKDNRPDVLWYYFSLPICFLGYVMNRNHYVYEESDMTHLSVKSGILRLLFEKVDKFLIRHSSLSLLTSEGFLKYHFGDKIIENVIIVPNKLRQDVAELPVVQKKDHIDGGLRFGFVGFIRYRSVLNLVEVISTNYPQHEIHFYGVMYESATQNMFESLKKRENVFFHGSFKNPDDLPDIYSNIDVVISTYDITSINAQYAEPNKLYESIYFRTPIIVSEGTFLATQVEKFQCGYVVNPFDDYSIINLVKTIERDLINLTGKLNEIERTFALDNPDELFSRIEMLQ